MFNKISTKIGHWCKRPLFESAPVAVIVFSQPIPFPIAPLREMLTKYFADHKWQCGEYDTGAPKQMGTYSPSDVIVGRSGSERIMVPLTARHGRRSDDAPPHEWSLEIGNATTDNVRLAERITVLICSILMIPDERDARCQLVPDGDWLTIRSIVDGLKLIEDGAMLADVLGAAKAAPASRSAGVPIAQDDDRSFLDQAIARMLHGRGMGDVADEMGLTLPPRFAGELPQPNGLPTLVMLSTSPLFIDWAKTSEALRAIDPDEEWLVTPDGPTSGQLAGRTAVVTIRCSDQPLPAYLMTQGMAREHYLTSELRADMMRHCAYSAFDIAIDTEAAGFINTRETAKAVAMVMALLSTNPAFVGMYNAGLGVARPAPRVRDSLGALLQNEVPIGIWIWAAPDSPVTDAVSISTSGMRPFVGYEVECWNAPGTMAEVAERLNGVLRYLLINGPVIQHGDTIGINSGDRSTRCFHGVSNAQRSEEGVPALLLEFDNKGGVKPRADISRAVGDVAGADPIAALRPQPAPAQPFPRPMPDADGKTRVFPLSLFEGEHGAFLRAVGMSPDDPGNIVPTEDDYRQMLDRSRIAMSQRCDRIEAEMRARYGHGLVRPYFILGELTMHTALGDFLVHNLELLPFDEWNMVALAKDDRTAALSGLPRHPGENIEAFDRRGLEFVTGLHRIFGETMKSVDPMAEDFVDRLGEIDVAKLKSDTRSAIIDWVADQKPVLLSTLRAKATPSPMHMRTPPVFGRKAAGGFGRKGL